MVSTKISESQRVDGGLIIRKQTMIVKNLNPVEDVYEIAKKVSWIDDLRLGI